MHYLRIDCSYARQSAVYDARYQGIVKVEYPLHPLFGREGTVVRQVRYAGVAFLDLVVDGNRVTVPQWITRTDECQHLTCGYDPFCSWFTLLDLVALLDGRGV